MKTPNGTNAENFQRSAMRAGDDRGGGVHEHELEQEEREDADVVGAVTQRAEEEALGAERGPSRAPERITWSSGSTPPSSAMRPEAAELQREADRPVRERADGEDDEVRHRDVRRVLRPAEAGLDEHEARLHEEDERHAHDDEEHVRAALRWPRSGADLGERRRAGRRGGDVGDAAGGRAGRVAALRQRDARDQQRRSTSEDRGADRARAQDPGHGLRLRQS